LKILVLSLLRLGDLLMQKSLLASAKKKFPQAEIHFLIHRDFQSVQSLIPEVERFHFFERQEWSCWINQMEVPLLKPVKALDTLIQGLNENKFDQVWNWTHQKGSAYLMELIDAPVKVGLQTIKGRFSFENSTALRRFNDEFVQLNHSGPHGIEHLAAITDLEVPPPQKVRRSLSSNKENLIFIQPLTSDTKKNWGLQHFREWMDLHLKVRPQDQVYVLGSPSERGLLEEEFTQSSVKTVSLNEAKHLLANGDLLISADTAIKHLGSLQGIQILELAFGSAQPMKTGAWIDESYAIISDVPCSPCFHSQNCSQLSHLCGERFTPAELFEHILALIEGRTHSNVKKIIKEVMVDSMNHGGFNVARN